MPATPRTPPSRTLPEHLEMQRTQVVCGPDLNYHVSSIIALQSLAVQKLKQPYVSTAADLDPDLGEHVYGTGYQQRMGF